MPRLGATLIGLLLPAACATVSTGIRPAGGPDSWTLTERDSPLNGGAARAARDATAKARAFCAGRGADFVPETAQDLGRPVQVQLVGPTGYRLTFRCRAPDAPDEPDPASGTPPP